MGLKCLAHLALTSGTCDHHRVQTRHPSCGQPLVTRAWGAEGEQGPRLGRRKGRFFLVPTRLSLPPQVVELPVTERQIEREHLIQLRRWQDTRGELQCHSPPRLHGAKAILEAEPGPWPTLQPSPSIRLPPDAPLPGSKGKYTSRPSRSRRSNGSRRRQVGSGTSPRPQVKPRWQLLRETHVPHGMCPQRTRSTRTPKTQLPRTQPTTAPRRA